MKKEDILNKIKDFIVDKYQVKGKEDDIIGIDLFEDGYINSFGLVKLIAFLEDEFKISFNETYLYDERFVSIKGQSEIIYEIKTR